MHVYHVYIYISYITSVQRTNVSGLLLTRMAASEHCCVCVCIYIYIYVCVYIYIYLFTSICFFYVLHSFI